MNLLSKLHKNSILTGPIESYCLACSCLLRSEEESYAHIHQLQHVNKLKALPPLESYKEDCIIKIKEGYFCPHCNIILPTIKRISLHVIEPKHKDNRISQSISRHGACIVFRDSVVLAARAWHGVAGGTCAVCDEDYADEEQHTAAPGHALRLIQAPCQFGDNYVYRNVDEDLFFCLICKNILPATEKESHHESERHLELYKQSKNECTAIKRKQYPEENNNIAPVESSLPGIKHKDTNANIIKDSKDASNNNHNAQVNKAENGSSRIVDDNGAATEKYTQGFNSNEASVNTGKIQTEVSKTGPINKSQGPTKVINQSKAEECDCFRQIRKNVQETAKSNTSKVTQDKNTKESENVIEKVNLPTKALHNAKIQDNNTDVNVKVAAKTKSTQETTKVDIQAKELEDPNPMSVLKSDIVEPVDPKSDVNGADKKDAKPYILEFLESNNFIIRLNNNSSFFCTLCEASVDVKDQSIHSNEKHHSILYEKHIARNKLAERNKKRTAGKETNGIQMSNAADSESTALVSEETKDKVESQPEKPTEVSTKNVKDDNNPDTKNQAPKEETVVPENKIENGTIPVSETTTAHLAKKATKKAQKKAAKAKAEIISSQSELDSVLPEDNTTEANDIRDQETDATCLNINGKDKQDANVALVNTTIHPEKTKGPITKNKEIKMTDAKPKTEKLLTVIKTISQVDSSPEDVVINCKYVVGNMSFVLFVRNGDKVQCVACDELTVDVQKHISTDEHKANVENSLVITSIDDEFIRQVKSGEYHCGYCNLTLADWAGTTAHLQTYRHTDAKVSATWRLQRYLPLLKHSQTREVRSVLTAVFRRTVE